MLWEGFLCCILRELQLCWGRRDLIFHVDSQVRMPLLKTSGGFALPTVYCRESCKIRIFCCCFDVNTVA